MPDAPVVHIGENSPEEVAYKMMLLIGSAEGLETYGHGDHPMTREWILRTYAQCLAVVQRGDAQKRLDDYKPESFARRR